MKIARVVAAWHPCAQPRIAFDALAERVRALDAELIGLFIEDIELLHFAGMPFAAEIGSASARLRSVDAPAMERYMQARASELREALNSVLGGSSLSWSFRVARATVADALAAAVLEQSGATLLLPPGADIDMPPRIVARSEFEQLRRHLNPYAAQPIVLLEASV